MLGSSRKLLKPEVFFTSLSESLTQRNDEVFVFFFGALSESQHETPGSNKVSLRDENIGNKTGGKKVLPLNSFPLFSHCLFQPFSVFVLQRQTTNFFLV